MKLGIITGTGSSDFEGYEIKGEDKVETPYGLAGIIRATAGEHEVVIVPRHGKRHECTPRGVKYKINVMALFQEKVDAIFAISAVGSLRPGVKPGDFVIVNDFINTKIPEESFIVKRDEKDRVIRGGVEIKTGVIAHLNMAEGFCNNLRSKLSNAAYKLEEEGNLDIRVHRSGVYVVVSGSRYSTPAESRVYGTVWSGKVVGMTVFPECYLARELQIPYVCIATVTDYDNLDAERNPVVTVDVSEIAPQNVRNALKLIRRTIDDMDGVEDCPCRHSLTGAILNLFDESLLKEHYGERFADMILEAYKEQTEKR